MSQVQKDDASKPPSSPWSIRIATVSGIPIRLHFTFLLFLAWVAIVGRQQGSWIWPVLVATLFFCVVLHELGHALVALHFGVRTRDITLYPIGGLAVLQDRPTAKQELFIALAGPLVNLIIAGALCIVLVVHGGSVLPPGSQDEFLVDVMQANLLLAAFNLIPAFPMDGGRVLRAALALFMEFNRATQIAAGIGQALAIALGLAGLLMGNYILVFIAFFVFLGAGQESSVSTARSFLEGHTIRDAMQSRFRTISHGATLETAASMLLEGSQHDFPVIAGGEPVGILLSGEIARGLSEAGPEAYVSEFMDRKIQVVDSVGQLTDALEMFNQSGAKPAFVMENGGLVGLLTRENLGEFIMLEAARHHSRSSSAKMTDQ